MKKSFIRNMTRTTPYIISAASLIFAAQFLYHAIQGSIQTPNPIWVFFTFIISIFIFIGLRNEFKIVRKMKLYRADYQLPMLLKIALVVFGNTMFTYFLAIQFETSTIFAASLICVLSAYILPNYEAEAYSGSVAGMVGAFLSGHWSVAVLTGLVTSFVFILYKPYFRGVGGRGGSIPYVATILSVRLILNLQPLKQPPIQDEFILPSLVVILLITLITYLLHNFEILSVVKAAMVVSLISSILIPNEYYTITTAMFAGTIVGMSVDERIESSFHLLVVAVISFILFVPSFHILDGIGGKLGILSLLSYYGSMGIKHVFPKNKKAV